MEPEKAAKTSEDEAQFVALLTAGQAAISVVVRALMPGESGFEEVVQQTNAKLWEIGRIHSSGTSVNLQLERTDVSH